MALIFSIGPINVLIFCSYTFILSLSCKGLIAAKIYALDMVHEAVTASQSSTDNNENSLNTTPVVISKCDDSCSFNFLAILLNSLFCKSEAKLIYRSQGKIILNQMI